MSAESERAGELRKGLELVRRRIDLACADAGRDTGTVTLVVVTKFFPSADVTVLSTLGVTDIGENKDQEVAPKVAELEEMVRASLRVHFVGQLQTNKARSVARYADAVHSVDRARLVTALERAMGNAVESGERPAQPRLDVCIQVDLGEGEQAGRGGAGPSSVPGLADRVASCEHLRLAGLMAVAPPGLDEGETHAGFDRLRALGSALREQHPDAWWISAGMSGDLEAAVAAGATHLRVGSAILGSRPRQR